MSERKAPRATEGESPVNTGNRGSSFRQGGDKRPRNKREAYRRPTPADGAAVSTAVKKAVSSVNPYLVAFLLFILVGGRLVFGILDGLGKSRHAPGVQV